MCVYVCMYVCMYVYRYVCVCVCIYVRMCVCTDMRRLKTRVRSEKCVVGRIRRSANVFLRKPR